MAELVIIIGQTKTDVLDALKMKSTLEKIGITVMKVVTRETGGKKIPHELIESLLKTKVLTNVKLED